MTHLSGRAQALQLQGPGFVPGQSLSVASAMSNWYSDISMLGQSLDGKELTIQLYHPEA